MISLHNISKQFSGRYLFRGVSLRLGDEERVAVVGSNGAGKSTLMRIIMDLAEPDSGEIIRSRSNTAGYLPQDGVIHSGRTLYDETATAFDDIITLQTRADDIGREIDDLSKDGKGKSPEVSELAEELGKIQLHLEHLEGYKVESRIKKVLLGLGFKEKDFGRMTDEFSGGWQMRIALAKLLLCEPTVLMLDEPTNHLDIESLEWLEEALMTYKGSVVLVSHDRRFLDNVVKRTIEISMGKLSDYKGNYSYYLKEKAERMDILRSRFENQQERIRTTMRFVDRFRYKATKARQVQSRLRMLDKMDHIEMEDEESDISFDFPKPPVPGRVMVKLAHVSKTYGELEVFKNVSFSLERGDKVAFLGVNGAGKSTLARIIAGIEPFGKGDRTTGHRVILSYYAQNQAEELISNKTVLQTVEEVASGEEHTRLRTLLGCFLFSGDEVYKTVSILSGGEKSRLALAKMLLTPANLLILDEPTNHLDTRSKTVLQKALARFEGSYVIVSHDRDFLEPLINKVAEFKKGEVKIHLGKVSEYLEKTHKQREEEKQKDKVFFSDNATFELGQPKKTGQRALKERKRKEAEKRQKRYKKVKPLKVRILDIENKIALTETRKNELEKELSSDKVYQNGETARALSFEYKEVTSNLAYLYDEWTQLHEKIEKLEEHDYA